jgi:hypothetical protein
MMSKSERSFADRAINKICRQTDRYHPIFYSHDMITLGYHCVAIVIRHKTNLSIFEAVIGCPFIINRFNITMLGEHHHVKIIENHGEFQMKRGDE